MRPALTLPHFLVLKAWRTECTITSDANLWQFLFHYYFFIWLLCISTSFDLSHSQLILTIQRACSFEEKFHQFQFAVQYLRMRAHCLINQIYIIVSPNVTLPECNFYFVNGHDQVSEVIIQKFFLYQHGRVHHQPYLFLRITKKSNDWHFQKSSTTF